MATRLLRVVEMGRRCVDDLVTGHLRYLLAHSLRSRYLHNEMFLSFEYRRPNSQKYFKQIKSLVHKPITKYINEHANTACQWEAWLIHAVSEFDWLSIRHLIERQKTIGRKYIWTVTQQKRQLYPELYAILL